MPPDEETTTSFLSFAPFWFRDALFETGGNDSRATRREIVFTAAFLENYWFHWAQTLLYLQGGPDEVTRVFTPGKPVPSLRRKFRKSMTTLGFESLSETTALGQDFDRFVNYRGILLHGKSSRFRVTKDVVEVSRPELSMEELESIPHGWALDVALQSADYLHQQSATKRPGWLKPERIQTF